MLTMKSEPLYAHDLLLDGVMFPQNGITIQDDGEQVDVSYFDADLGRTVEFYVPVPRPYLTVTGPNQPSTGVYPFEIRSKSGTRVSGMVDVVDKFGEMRMYIFDRD